MSSEQGTGYADLQETKRRLNIPDSTTSSDIKIAANMREADNYINTQSALHATVPFTNPDPELISLSSSLAAALFNYWQTPIKERNLDGVKEWKKSISGHILAVYGRKNVNGLAGGKTFGSTTGFTNGTR